MTLVIISNIILCAVVLAAIVAKLVWAIATQHRDHSTLIPARRSSEVAKGLALHEDSRQLTELTIVQLRIPDNG
jgi:hypothetical protein